MCSKCRRTIQLFCLINVNVFTQSIEQNGCKEILRSIQPASLPAHLSLKKEVQLGRSKVFIRTPEMYFAFEQLREKAFER